MNYVRTSDYCRRCRKFHIAKPHSTTNYCSNCCNAIASNKKAFNRWLSSDIFIELSFIDCIEKRKWDGFKNIKYQPSIIKKIISKFSDVNYHQSISIVKDFISIDDVRFLYLVSDNEKNLLKVGQTSNIVSRFQQYYNLSQHKPLRYDIFYVNSFEQQDLYENKIRNYLEYLGYLLPKDNSHSRLKYIKELI